MMDYKVIYNSLKKWKMQFVSQTVRLFVSCCSCFARRHSALLNHTEIKRSGYSGDVTGCPGYNYGEQLLTSCRMASLLQWSRFFHFFRDLSSKRRGAAVSEVLAPVTVDWSLCSLQPYLIKFSSVNCKIDKTEGKLYQYIVPTIREI